MLPTYAYDCIPRESSFLQTKLTYFTLVPFDFRNSRSNFILETDGSGFALSETNIGNTPDGDNRLCMVQRRAGTGPDYHFSASFSGGSSAPNVKIANPTGKCNRPRPHSLVVTFCPPRYSVDANASRG